MGSCYVVYEMENMTVWLVVVWHKNWMLDMTCGFCW